jgi:hypothetical protein
MIRGYERELLRAKLRIKFGASFENIRRLEKSSSKLIFGADRKKYYPDLKKWFQMCLDRLVYD